MKLPSRGRHQRCRWLNTDPAEIFVHAQWEVLKGSVESHGHDKSFIADRYARAKRQFDIEAASDIVRELIQTPVVDRLVDVVLKSDRTVSIITPHPEFDIDDDHRDDPDQITNALPHAYAAYLAKEFDCEIDDRIVETARPGRTKLKMWERFLWQPRFQGEVRHDRAYIIVDDVCTTGGTMAVLRSHIVEHGGTVIAASSLANQNGKNCRFPIAPSAIDMVRSHYTELIDSLWETEVGHDITCLTDNEAQKLIEWQKNERLSGEPLFNRLRGRLRQTAAKGGE